MQSLYKGVPPVFLTLLLAAFISAALACGGGSEPEEPASIPTDAPTQAKAAHTPTPTIAPTPAPTPAPTQLAATASTTPEPAPTLTPIPMATSTPTAMPEPTAMATPMPASTQVPTATPTPDPTPEPTPEPTDPALDEYLAQLGCASIEEEEEDPETYAELSAQIGEIIDRMSSLDPPAEIGEWHSLILALYEDTRDSLDALPKDDAIELTGLLAILESFKAADKKEKEILSRMSDDVRQRMAAV